MVANEKQAVRICDLLLNAAERWPDSPAITFREKTQTWQETRKRCHAAATLFTAAGVGKADRVAYLGFNSNVCFESYFSPALIGAISVPINYRLSLGEMIECVGDCTPKILIVEPEFLEQARALVEQCDCLKQVLLTGNEAGVDGFDSFEQSISTVIESDSYCQLSPSENHDTVMIFYTGGTTGRSKGVMLSNINIQCNTDGSIPLYRMQQGWNFIIVGPLFHLAAGARVFTCAALGGHAVILQKFDVHEALQTIERYQIDTATLVPTMFQMMLDHESFGKFDISSLKMLAYGAAPASVDLLARVIKGFPDINIYQTFGMTEASPILTTLDSKYHVLEGLNSGKLASVGKPANHVELIIADEEDRALPAGETGQILVRGANIMTGYWHRPELTAETLKGGWHHTGDAGFLDEDGFLFLEGRVKDMIVSGGENVYPIEVENVLAGHPAIRECAVIGVPHETWGEAVHAVLVLEQDAQLSEQGIISYCKEHIAGYKCPVSVTFRDEPMPLSPINKILKTELRKPFWEGRQSKLV